MIINPAYNGGGGITLVQKWCPNSEGVTTLTLDPAKDYVWEVSYFSDSYKGAAKWGTIIDGTVSVVGQDGNPNMLGPHDWVGAPSFDASTGVLTLVKGYDKDYPTCNRIYCVE